MTRTKCTEPMVLFLIGLWVSCFTQSALLGAPPQDSQGKVVRAIRVEESPVLDGNLDEALWRQVPATSDFLQRDPREGEPATPQFSSQLAF